SHSYTPTLSLTRRSSDLDLLVNNGIKGIFICGSTGEGPSLTVSERKELAEAFVAAAAKRLKVFVHVGHNSLEDAMELARHAEQRSEERRGGKEWSWRGER